MADVVIFGVRDFASLAHFYLRHDSAHRVVAFTVHRDYLPPEGEFEGLPVVPFEELEERFPPGQFSAFAPMSHREMNRLRERIFNELRARGYELISYVSSRADRMPETHVGKNCFVLEGCAIQPFATVGDNVMIWSGAYIGHHSVIEDHAFITSHVIVSGHCRVGKNSFLGVNATLRDQITIGEGTLVGMGARVTRNSEPWSVYKGEATRPTGQSSLDIDF